MPHPESLLTLYQVVRRPGMYGMQDVMDLSAFLTGFMMGGDHPEVQRLLNELTEFIKAEHPEFEESTAGWSHFIKGFSWERGGSLKLFKLTLARMLLQQGHWTEEHFATFTSDTHASNEAWDALPIPIYPQH